MSWLSNFAQQFGDDLAKSVGRFKNRTFMEATITACALVAAADGEIKRDEKAKMIGFIERSPVLSVFDMSDVTAVFNQVADNLKFDFDIGKDAALKVVRKLKPNPEAAQTAVRVCCAIGAADGDFDPDEKAIVREICEALGLDPAKFKL